jgi:hypothetical protein
MAVIKRSYNGQWVYTAAHPVAGSKAEESIAEVTAWAKENVTP